MANQIVTKISEIFTSITETSPEEFSKAVSDLIESSTAKFNSVLPQETRAQWISEAAKQPILSAVVCIILVSLLCRCCSNDKKMMKAPGTGGRKYMPRSSFEKDPGSHFKSIRRKH